ncbi:hypothetical protein [Corynebacterium endometrii]|uniref:Uncharacterized protein n=1 Tax=Corynebacterium endometrii TaxID=2488819 RepID=A0A4P7QI64_9CORY|nr:hypothetical protein [Corynebacterium endometrii]QCB29230.1 hypothetical protein CENDO_09880 [Corynebacterium endometrii]
MSDSYNWGLPQQPQKAPQQQPQPNQTARTASPTPQPSGNSGLAKKVGIGAVAVVAVAALGVGGFQVYKSTQVGAPNPLGITDEVAEDLVRSEFDDCMLTPELIQAAGIKELKQSEDDDNTCVGYFEGPNGNNNVEVRIRVQQSSSGEAGRSDIEGWKEYSSAPDSQQEELNFVNFVNSLEGEVPDSSGHVNYCRLEGDEREIEGVHLIGPTCDSLAPLANQIMNVVKQDIYNSTDTDFFEIKDKPTYVETQPTTTVDVALPGFYEAYDNAPESGSEVEILERYFEGSTLTVTAPYASTEHAYDVCMDAVYTLGTKTDPDRSGYDLPSIQMIASDGSVSTMLIDFKDYGDHRLSAGDSIDLAYCSTESNDDYVAVFSDENQDEYYRELRYSREGVPNTIAKWSRIQEEESESA